MNPQPVKEKFSPKVSVVVLNWNGKEDTLECLESLKKLEYPNYDVVVVDNGSSDDSVDAIKRTYPSVTVLEEGKNLGYAGGNNVGMRYAIKHGAEYVLLLNNDTVVADDILTRFIDGVKITGGRGIFGSKIYFYSDPLRIWYAGAKWDTAKQEFIHIGMDKHDNGEFDSIIEVDYVTGCAIFMRSDVIKQVGMLDEKFFLTYEETDWCYRARKLGIKSIYVPKAKVWHKVSVSFGGNESPLANYFMTRNKLLWAKKHLGVQDRFLLKLKLLEELKNSFIPPFIVDCTSTTSKVKMAYWAWIQFWGELRKRYQNPVNKARLLGLRDYVLHRFGDCPESVRKLNKIPQ